MAVEKLETGVQDEAERLKELWLADLHSTVALAEGDEAFLQWLEQAENKNGATVFAAQQRNREIHLATGGTEIIEEQFRTLRQVFSDFR